jgi:hypothetical protein
MVMLNFQTTVPVQKAGPQRSAFLLEPSAAGFIGTMAPLARARAFTGLGILATLQRTARLAPKALT